MGMKVNNTGDIAVNNTRGMNKIILGMDMKVNNTKGMKVNNTRYMIINNTRDGCESK